MNKNISIRVENLGPIKGPETIYLRPLMILSGSSGLGKSYVAMLLHFIYRVLCGDEILRFLKSKEINFDKLKLNLPLDEESVICKIEVRDFLEWVDRRALTYMINMLGYPKFKATIHIDIPDLPEYFTFMYSRNAVMARDNEEMIYVERLNFLEGNDIVQFPQLSASTWESFPFSILLKQYFRRKYDLNPNRTFLMPPSRGSYVAIPDDLRLRMGDRETIGMYKEFLDDLSTLKTIKPNRRITERGRTAISTLQSEILHGSISVEDNDIVYRIDDFLEIPITAAASSIKEISPFAIMTSKGLLGEYSILFEEPESHLHPELQLKIADLIAYSLNEGSHLQITTHNDYLLRHINDLIRLHILKKEIGDEKQYIELCESIGYNPNITIDPDCVSALYFQMTENEGSCIKKQDIEFGIPFDTFSRVNDEQLTQSAKLYDFLESYKSKSI